MTTKRRTIGEHVTKALKSDKGVEYIRLYLMGRLSEWVNESQDRTKVLLRDLNNAIKRHDFAGADEIIKELHTLNDRHAESLTNTFAKLVQRVV